MPSDAQSKFYLTTPIYYVNARPHIGHAYTTIVADVLARRHRLLGDDTFFLTGTDEHGQKIERSAAAAGIPPQQFADDVSAQFRALWDRMGLTYNRYIRTTDPAHKQGAQQLFRTLYERGFIYLSTYTGSYCVSDEAFVDLPAGAPCPDCGRPLETVTEENFFFKLSEFQKPLLNLIESNEFLITPDTARNEVLSFVRGGLKDLSISRSSFTWGIPVPDDVQKAAGTTQKHVIYVWLDALTNYMTAIGYGSDDPAQQAEFSRYWPADLHLVGKEITRFHCVYWPAFLLAAGLPTPKQITANGWLLFDNAKMSKSRGNVVRTETILDAFGTLCPPIHATTDAKATEAFAEARQGKGTASAVPQNAAEKAALAAEVRPPTEHERDLFAADVLRYFLLREIPFGQDGSFSFDALVTRYNADLANGYGNLVSRVLNLINQNQDGKLPAHKPFHQFAIHLRDRIPQKHELVNPASIREVSVRGPELAGDAAAVQAFYNRAFDDLNFALPLDSDLQSASRAGVLDSVMFLLSRTDAYITANAPWKLAKQSDPGAAAALQDILYTAAEAIRIITLLLHPILPNATAKVWQQLGLGDIALSTEHQPLSTLLEWGGLKPGTKLGPLSPIFPRADKSLAQVMIDMEEARNTPKLPIQETTDIPMVTEASLPGASTTESLAGEKMPTTPDNKPTTDPAAPPRTSSLDEPSGTLPVAGSTAPNTTLPTTPGPHTQAPASGVFSSQPQPATSHQPPATPETITIDDFMKVELRVAQVLVAERIPKADKLLRLEVDLGTEKRQILSGIAQYYAPEELIGRRIVVVSNLAPRKMRGLDSHGMLLAASEGPDGKPILATFGEDIALGSRVR